MPGAHTPTQFVSADRLAILAEQRRRLVVWREEHQCAIYLECLTFKLLRNSLTYFEPLLQHYRISDVM